MDLNSVKLNTNCVIKKINVKDEKTKFRLMELGLVIGTNIKVIKRSVFKKTLLVTFSQCCFTLKDNLAKEFEVEYA